MKQALIAVSFGSSVARAREEIGAVEAALAAAAPDYAFRRAYTSPTIRRILAGRGEVVDSLPEALDRLAAEGFDRVLVQPTHLLYGFEYEAIERQVRAAAGRFDTLKLGRPLMADDTALRALAACVAESYPVQPGQGLVLMGHGTAHFANMVYPALQTAFRLQGADRVYVGTVEGWPGFAEVLAQLQADGVTRVQLAPFMLVAGDHALNDMAGEEPDSWKSRLAAAGIAADCRMQGLAQLAPVRALYAARLKELMPDGL